MSVEIKVPSVGESITEVTVGNWLKEDGEYVEMDEQICELESDKATFELTAEASGILKHKAKEGDTLEIGQVICEIDEEAKKESGPEKENPKEKTPEENKSGNTAEPAPSKTGNTVEMHVPEVGESITEVTISNWAKKDGDFVELDEVIAEMESDKATFELTAEAQGILHIKVQDEATLKIGDLICTIDETDTPSEVSSPEHKEERPATSQQSSDAHYAQGHPSPAAAKILEEKGISPKEVKGTGVDGRITREDAQHAEKPTGSKPEKVPEKPGENGQAPSTAPGGNREEKGRRCLPCARPYRAGSWLLKMKRPCSPPSTR